MLSETLASELESYRIGSRIKALRLKKRLGLVQLGEHTGISSAMLSKIERGQIIPTLPTLTKIALVFGVDLSHFFSKNAPRIAVTRQGERVRLPIPANSSPAFYLFESLDYPLPDRKMEAFLAEFQQSGTTSEPHQHGSEEFIYVLEGSLSVIVDGEEEILDEGDAMSFDSSAPHSYKLRDRKICRALVVTAT